MRVIIAGSRKITDYAAVEGAVERFVSAHGPITLVLSGHARGVDRLGELWAYDNGIPVEKHPAKWEQFGRSAGMIRNREMLERADGLVARNMIELAWQRKIKVVTVRCA